jgi:EAL domain-containing protein (putative c-di-GMP-specific phosphodiesterase class I)
MEDDLRAALAENQFQLHFQPIVAAADRRVNSFEALLRWNHPVRGAVPPDDFIPTAEEMGLIVPIGEWVVREACKQAAKWPETIKIAVNISAAQFGAPGLVEAISAAIDRAGVSGSRLIVEVTESVMIKDAERATTTLHAFRKLGAKIAMDDFGTGYSSLSYLRRFPFDKIKIDRSFVSEVDESDDAAEIVRATISMAKALGMITVAEGVETESQFARLALEGCNEIQGYLIARPMPAGDVLRFLGIEPQTLETEDVSIAPDDAVAAAADRKKPGPHGGFVRHIAPMAVASGQRGGSAPAPRLPRRQTGLS